MKRKIVNKNTFYENGNEQKNKKTKDTKITHKLSAHKTAISSLSIGFILGDKRALIKE